MESPPTESARIDLQKPLLTNMKILKNCLKIIGARTPLQEKKYIVQRIQVKKEGTLENTTNMYGFKKKCTTIE